MREPAHNTGGKRALRFALGLLALLYALAVLAPLLANDRPLWIVARERTASAESASASFPAFADLSAQEQCALAIVPLALAAFLVLRRRHSLRAEAVVAGAILCGALLLALQHGSAARAPKDWKQRIDTGELLVEHALFAPIAFGADETNLSEAWRPPTWLAASAVDESGRRLRDRSASTQPGELVAPPIVVLVKSSEPARNSWRRHLLGTDGLGRDVCARLLWGARASL